MGSFPSSSSSSSDYHHGPLRDHANSLASSNGGDILVTWQSLSKTVLHMPGVITPPLDRNTNGNGSHILLTKKQKNKKKGVKKKKKARNVVVVDFVEQIQTQNGVRRRPRSLICRALAVATRVILPRRACLCAAESLVSRLMLD